MAESNNRSDRNEQRRLRKERRAVQEAAAQAQEAKEARERRQQTIIGAIVVAVIVVLIAVVGVVIYRNTHPDNSGQSQSASASYAALQKVANTPPGANDRGGFLISKHGYNKRVENAPTVAEYFDPLCPGCAALNRQVDPTLKALVDAGQINLELHPMSFMDQLSTDEYSSRVSGSIAYIASHDDNPDHLIAYMEAIYAEDFQPKEGTTNYQPVSDAKLKAQALKAGVPTAIVDKAFGRQYQKWLDAVNDYTPKRPELWNTEGSDKGAMTTPTVTINGKALNMVQIAQLGIPLKSAVLQSLGLAESAVGSQGAMPSIGAAGKPLAPKAS